MISIFLGIISVIIGVFGLIVGWEYFIDFIFGILPISFLMAGIIAIIAGFAGLKDYRNAQKDEEKLKNE